MYGLLEVTKGEARAGLSPLAQPREHDYDVLVSRLLIVEIGRWVCRYVDLSESERERTKASAVDALR